MNDNLKATVVLFSFLAAVFWSDQSTSNEAESKSDFSQENQYINDALIELDTETPSFSTDSLKIAKSLRELEEASKIQTEEVIGRQEFDFLFSEAPTFEDKSALQKSKLYEKYSKQTGLSVEEIKALFESDLNKEVNPRISQ
ncbi:hypothetical protein GCM10008090_29390 [Arenicella chitinivorans]|uniref:Uncharacterized protein n=1 Tax=Arenicella chitinivorans TaxID=1329800 RepID=A0A918S0P0_9GAMM|nr:hypothetical protein [Arenicella chitinivorans]GHA17811.1 hypothetical protein GCM10008090_29390 [Arenicella chitinivorans]